MKSLTSYMSIVVAPPCGSSSFPAYRGLALLKTMPSDLLTLVFICFPHNCDDTCYFQHSESQLSYIYTAYAPLACVAFATILHFQTLATCEATTWLVVTRPAAGHPSSVLSRALHQSNFAILAICPLTLADWLMLLLLLRKK